jgi:hypothetical protein
MKKLLMFGMIALGSITYAKAQVSVNINAGVVIGPRHGVVCAPPVVYQRPPVRACAPAQVVYVAPPPPPVYYAPAPVYVERRVYYEDRCDRGHGHGHAYGHEKNWKREYRD